MKTRRRLLPLLLVAALLPGCVIGHYDPEATPAEHYFGQERVASMTFVPSGYTRALREPPRPKPPADVVTSPGEER